MSHNVFAYCLNNPVNVSDDKGNLPSFNDIKNWLANAVSSVKGVLSAVLYIHPGAFVVQDSFSDPYNSDVNAALEDEKAFKQNVKQAVFGAKGVQVTSKTVWKSGKTERIDVENLAPGKRAGDLHYHEPNDTKWRFDINDKLFINPKTLEPAPIRIQNLLSKSEIQNAIKKGLDLLGESVKLFK